MAGWRDAPVVPSGNVRAPPRGTPPTALQGAQEDVLTAQQPTVGLKARAELDKATAEARTAELALEAARRTTQQNKPDTAGLRASIVRSIESAMLAKRRSQTQFAATGLGSDTFTGAGSPVSGIREILKPITANIALNQIVELKKAGVALTPISDTDIRLLSSTVAGIDPLQPDEDFQRSMNTVIAHYTKMLDGLDRIPTAEGARAALAARAAAREAAGGK